MKLKKYLIPFLLVGTWINANAQAKHIFSIDHDTFQLDGKTFQIISGEMHYERVPRPYWRDRLKKARSMGLNTICTYMFWNAHEQTSGTYKFNDNLDIAEFCKEAAEEGLWVIIRPGPYGCGEWDLGALPAWLLKNKNVVMRTSDSSYMLPALKYLKKAVAAFKNSQITKGGNVLMVQLENEYGEYKSDKTYLSNIKQTLLSAGVDVPLFSCDWPGKDHYEKSRIDGVIPAINFGGKAQKNFETFAQYVPNGPRFNSEFWTGWFDYWGANHEVHSVKEKIEDFRWMIDHGVSVNLYMFHGGTTNGFFPGANGSGNYYTPYVNSYDYDAPLNEDGQPNDKFYAFRDVIMQKYPQLKLPELPAPIPKITIPEFELKPLASLVSNLPKAKKLESPQNMEALDQNYGLIMYAHDFAGSLIGELKLKRVMDRATVYIDGKKMATLDRRLNQSVLPVNIAAGKHRLEILVEALGRVNFGSAIDHERKGITEGVYLNGKLLKDWQHYQFPLDNITAVKAAAVKPGYPNFFKAEINVPIPGDTYFDTRHLDHGLLWLNEKLIGRYWRIGPQQTLFIPGCWLRKGINQITVLEMGSPSKLTLSGVEHQVWETRVDSSLLHTLPGKKIALAKMSLVKSGVFLNDEIWQSASFVKPVSARFVGLQSLSSYEQSEVSSIAELRLMDQNGREIPREQCAVIYADSEEIQQENGSADLLLDNQPTTSWQTHWSQKVLGQPHLVIIDLGKQTQLSGIRYLSGTQRTSAKIKNYNIYISKDNTFLEGK